MESYYIYTYICDQIWENMPSSHIYIATIFQLLWLINSIWNEIDVKLSESVELLFLYCLWKFQICILFPVVFINLQMSKMGSVNYARFPKFGHVYFLLSTHNKGMTWSGLKFME